MADETKATGQGGVKGDFATILVGVGTILDNTIEPLSKILVQTLDSLTVVAKQILEGVNSSLGCKK